MPLVSGGGLVPAYGRTRLAEACAAFYYHIPKYSPREAWSQVLSRHIECKAQCQISRCHISHSIARPTAFPDRTNPSH